MFGVKTYCAPNFIQNTDILISLGNTSAEEKGLEYTIAYNNIGSRFQNHVFYINFVLTGRSIEHWSLYSLSYKWIGMP